MKRIVSKHRLVSSLFIVMVVLSVSGILLRPRPAYAFTILPGQIIYDPVSVIQSHTLHVHVVNQLGMTPFGFFIQCKPTTPGLGSPASSAAFVLAPGDGSDQDFPFAAFAPTPGTTRIPVVCNVQVVVAPPATLPADFSGRVNSSVEIIDDTTGKQMLILGSRHIALMPSATSPPTPCVFCN